MQTSKLWLTIILGFGFFVLTLGTVRGESGIGGFVRLKRSLKVLSESTSELEKQNELLRQEIMKIEQSASYAERILRDKYHQKQQGERIVFFPD